MNFALNCIFISFEFSLNVWENPRPIPSLFKIALLCQHQGPPSPNAHPALQVFQHHNPSPRPSPPSQPSPAGSSTSPNPSQPDPSPADSQNQTMEAENKMFRSKRFGRNLLDLRSQLGRQCTVRSLVQTPAEPKAASNCTGSQPRQRQPRKKGTACVLPFLTMKDSCKK